VKGQLFVTQLPLLLEQRTAQHRLGRQAAASGLAQPVVTQIAGHQAHQRALPIQPLRDRLQVAADLTGADFPKPVALPAFDPSSQSLPVEPMIGPEDTVCDGISHSSAVPNPEPYDPACRRAADDNGPNPSGFKGPGHRGVRKVEDPDHLLATHGPHHQPPRQSRHSA